MAEPVIGRRVRSAFRALGLARAAECALIGYQKTAAYSATKSAIVMLTKVMARELGEHGVRVNCICPGVIKTKLSEALWVEPETEKAVAAQKALRRVGTTDELVGAAIYLASEASSFTTGAMLQVDGGMVI